MFNHLGCVGGALPFPGVCEEPLSGDPLAFFPWISRLANYLSAMAVTGDVFLERFARGWGDRGAPDDLTMEYKSANIFMYRARFCVGDRMHPDGRLAPGSAHAMRVISSVWRRMAPYLPDSLDNAPDFLALDSESMYAGKDHEKFARPRGSDAEIAGDHALMTNFGLYRLLVDCGRSFMITPEFMLARHLDPDRVLILPSIPYLRPESDAAIRAFLDAGGTVLAAGLLPRLFDDAAPDWLGMEYAGDTPVEIAVYLPDWKPGARPPDTERIMVRGDVMNVKTAGAEVLLRGYPQDYAHGLKKTTYTYYNSSAKNLLDTPLLTCRRCGKGKAYYLNCDLFRDYEACTLPEQKEWARELFRRTGSRAAFELYSKSGNVEIASYRDGQDATVHVLLNHGGRDGAIHDFFKCEHIVPPQPVYRTTLNIRSAEPLKFTVNGVAAAGKWAEGIASLDVAMDTMWKVVRAEKC